MAGLTEDGESEKLCVIVALFACLIIRIFQLVFSVETVFFSHNKSAGTVFRLVFQRSEWDPCARTRYNTNYWTRCIKEDEQSDQRVEINSK